MFSGNKVTSSIYSAVDCGLCPQTTVRFVAGTVIVSDMRAVVYAS